MTKQQFIERNRKAINRALWQSEDEREMLNFVQKTFGVDARDKAAFPVMEGNYSFGKLRQKLREADNESVFPQLLRAGIQAAVNAAYETVSTTFEEWTTSINSTRLEELYAPVQGIGFPSQLGEGETYPEVGMAALDIKLRNNKYGHMFPFSKELLEDDQTGQVQRQVGLMAEYAKQVLEVVTYGKLASVANMAYSTIKVPTSETKPSTEANYPWTLSSAPFVGGGWNAATPVALSQAAIQAGIIQMMNQQNLLGLKMSVQPKKAIISPHYRFDLAVLLHSGYYPTGATAGATGGAFSINPIEGILDMVCSRFVFNNAGSVAADSKAWYLVDSSVPFFVTQVKEAAVVEQENPQSGASFDRDIVRFKMRIRGNADFIDPRFAYRGSDGSV